MDAACLFLPYICFTEPKREVISIYNDNFKTPKNRPPYFIEVYRCVAIDNDEDKEACGDKNYPIPLNWTNIAIVVKDLGDETKFYKYMIYNHTSCACGDPAKPERKHIERLGK